MSRNSMSIPRFSLGGQQNISILQPKTLFHRKSIAGLSQNFGTENLPPSRASFGRNSFGRSSLSRRSSYLMEGKGVLKDPRSLNDKEYRRESIAILVRYLTENGYEHPIGIKSFANPAMKDYLRIFKFLYNQLDPHRKFTSPNYVEELPALMKELGYPFNINKSTFLAWTPRAWTCLLGCLLWLGELCSYFKKVGPMCFFPLHDDNFEDEVQSQRETERIFFEYISKAYISYLEGDDDYEGGAELSVFAEKNNLLQQQLVDINVAIERETQKLKQLEEEPSRLKILQSARENALSEKRKLVSLINEYKQHVAQCTNKEAEVYKELEEKSSELERLLTEKRNLENILETQELSQMDVEKINNERYQLELDLKELESHKNEAKKLNWEREKEYKQFFSSLMNDFHVYHQKAMRLHLLPSTAKLAGGVDYQLLINEEHSNPHEMLFVKLKGGIKPNLAQLKEALLKNIVDLQEESALLEDHLEQVKECIQEKEEELASSQEKLNRSRDMHKSEKENFAKIEKEAFLILEGLEEELQQLESMLSEGKLERLENEIEQNERQHELCVEEFCTQIYSVIDLASSHKEYISHKLSKLKKKSSSILQSFDAL